MHIQKRAFACLILNFLETVYGAQDPRGLHVVKKFGTSQQRTDVEISCNELVNNQAFGTSQQRTDEEPSCNDLVNDHSESQSVQIHPTAAQTFWSTPIGPTDVRKLDIIRFKRSADEEWTTGEILSRAGKSSGKFRNWWNIKNIQ